MKINTAGAPFPVLDSPIEVLLASGGDDRLELDGDSGFNSYGCAPIPGFRLSYSYSTASTISASAFYHVAAIHRRLQEKCETTAQEIVYRDKFDEFRARLTRALKLPDSTDIVFGPSGTDLELVALALSASSDSAKVHNIVLGLDEVGSGIRHVARGRYCKERTVMGSDVSVGGELPGFKSQNISTREIEIRSASGRPRPSEEVLDDIAKEIDSALSMGVRPLVHLIHRSKTGLITPRWGAFKQRFKNAFNDIDVVIDACQGRISDTNLAEYLNCGAMVLFTGSKFFGGPPFSGALFVPQHFKSRLRREDAPPLPVGLAEFFTKPEWPEGYRHALGSTPGYLNFGLLLRWESALYELERFCAVPEHLSWRVIAAFQRSIRRMCEKSPFIRIVAPISECEGLTPEPKAALEEEMIFTIALDNIAGRGELDSSDAKEIYRYLYNSVSIQSGDRRARAASETIVHLGQPVNCYRSENGRWLATLRVSLGAPLISELAFLDPSTIDERLEADMLLVADKLALAIASLDH